VIDVQHRPIAPETLVDLDRKATGLRVNLRLKAVAINVIRGGRMGGLCTIALTLQLG